MGDPYAIHAIDPRMDPALLGAGEPREFGESAFDQAREQGIPRDRALQLVARALAASIQAGVAASRQ